MRAAGVLALAAVVLLAAGCTLPEPVPPVTTPALPTGPTLPSPVLPTGTPPPEPEPEPHEARFEGARALAHVHAQVEDEAGGPRYRIPGTPGNTEAARLIDETLSDMGWNVTWHHFNATYGCEEVAMHNVVAERPGTSGRWVVFGAHYDTRPVADKDPDVSRRDEPILGANDGGSGVGVLLELARVLPPSQDGVRLVFFDGEDGGGYKGRECTDWILGSRAYAESLTAEQHAAIRAFVLVDMVGDPQLVMPYEMRSRNEGGRELQDQVYETGHSIGHGNQFLKQNGYAITDDHVPFLEAGVPAVDLIHTLPGDPKVFPSWHHTHEDDLDVVSADSLAAVGRTVETWFAQTYGETVS